MSTSFLPAINGTANLGNTGIEGLRTGQSFANTRNNPQIHTGRVSAIRSASITALLSPHEMVKSLSRGSNDFGIQGYMIPNTNALSPGKYTGGVIAKNKSLSPIEAEANYRKQFPGAGQYALSIEGPWN